MELAAFWGAARRRGAPRELEQLPGVGRKTANVVLNVAFGQPTMAVDTHIFRVSNRTGLAPGKNPLAVELQLMKRVPRNTPWIRTTGSSCTAAMCARQPCCWECAVSSYCDHQPKTTAA